MDPDQPTPGFFTNVHHMFDVRDVVDGMYVVLEQHYDTTSDGIHQVCTGAVLGFQGFGVVGFG